MLEIEVDPEILRQFEDIEAGSSSFAGKQWTDTENQLLLHYWPRKNKERVAQMLGVCANTARRQYRRLIQEASHGSDESRECDTDDDGGGRRK